MFNTLYKNKDNLNLDNIVNIDTVEEYEDNYTEFIDNDNKNIKKIKISEKLKILEETSPYYKFKSFNTLVSKVMLLSYTEPKFKLLQNSQMYQVEKLLPESKISFMGNLDNKIYEKKKEYYIYPKKYDEYITDLRFEILIGKEYNFNPSNFKYSDIFEIIELMIENTVVEILYADFMEFALSKNNLQWVYNKQEHMDTTLVLPIPFSLLSNQNGLFLNKIKMKSDESIKITVKMCSNELVENILSISHVGKYFNYSSFHRFPLKKMPVQYNMDLIKYLSYDPIVSNCEVSSLNSIFSTNYWTYQYNSYNYDYNVQQNINKIKLSFNGYIRGICFIIYDTDIGQNVTLDLFETITLQTEGSDYHYGDILTSTMLKYNMKNLKDFIIPDGYGYIDFDNFLNFDAINCFTICFKSNVDIINKYNSKKFNVEICGVGANTLLYLEGNIIKL
jgi:hypothetical protein